MKESSESLNNQAVSLAAKGQFEEAIACLKRALIVEQDNYLLWFNLGITYRDMGEFHNAKAALERAFRMNPEDGEIACELSMICLNLDEKEEALCYCSTALAFDNMNAKVWNTIGVICFNMENYQSASEAFEEAMCINPFYYDAIYNLRDTYLELNNQTGAEECNRLLKEFKGKK